MTVMNTRSGQLQVAEHGRSEVDSADRSNVDARDDQRVVHVDPARVGRCRSSEKRTGGWRDRAIDGTTGSRSRGLRGQPEDEEASHERGDRYHVAGSG
jgi:hypothetical protein